VRAWPADLSALRRRKTEQALAISIAALPGGDHLDPAVQALAAKANLAYAEQNGFTIGQGAAVVALLAAQYGHGFLHDAAHPQLAAVFRDDIAQDEAYRLSLLGQWAAWHRMRGAEPTPAVKLARLGRLARLIDHHDVSVLAQDPAWLFGEIDPASAALNAASQWHHIAQLWQDYFKSTFSGATAENLDFARALSFCLGQYFVSDPLWNQFADLRIVRLCQRSS
jgi:hypothetical protein